MKFNSDILSGIILIIAGVWQFLGTAAFPLWLILLCVGIMFLTEQR
jgi:hypothetical protein